MQSAPCDPRLVRDRVRGSLCPAAAGSRSSPVAARGETMTQSGVAAAIVVENNDPAGLGRVKVRYP